MRILVVSTRAADPERRAVFRILQRRGLDIILAVPERWRDATGAERQTVAADDGGLRVQPVPVAGPLDAPERLRWHAGTLRRLFRDLRPSVVHVEQEPWSPAARVVAQAARRLEIPYVLHVTDPIRPKLGWLDRRRVHAVLAGAQGLAAASTAAQALWRDELRGGIPTPLIIDVPTTVPPRQPPPPRDGLSIGFAGRLVPERGCDLLLRALTQLHGPWSLVVAGAGPSQESLEQLAERLGLAARIKWLGGLPADARETFWEGVDVFVLPARATSAWVEPSGVFLRDAMARRVAVITTACGALGDIADGGGVLVPAEDPTAIADVLRLWLEHPDLLQEQRLRARQRILEAYSPEASAERMQTLWEGARARLGNVRAAD